MIVVDLLYILQSEQYSFARFCKFVFSHLDWWRLQKRQKIKWTYKLRLIWSLTWLILLFLWFGSYLLFGFLGLFAGMFFLMTLPLIIGFVLSIIWPFDYLVKQQIIRKAKKIIQKEAFFVIGITGSYGKTSTKEMLNTILKEQFKVIVTPENINTDLGVAQFIIKNQEELKQAEILIVEMGAYRLGDIKNICDIVRPDIGLLTGINEAHLERFGSLENTIKAKFELALAAQKMVIFNLDDRNIAMNYERFKVDNMIGTTKNNVQEINFKENFAGFSFVFEDIKFNTKLLAEHNISLILLCIEAAKFLGMDKNKIISGVAASEYVPHRLEPIYNRQTDIWVIDDSYNGNKNGIISGIEVVNRGKGRKIVLTPGLVELGSQEKVIHQEIGELYIESGIDLVLLIKNRVTGYVEAVFKKNNYHTYKMYESTEAAHADLPNILKKGDTIIFQNDWPDQYF
jgi:UDP-N-acetylmuramoyl-tripeptide--D-alanyl-D-alanine ligase